VVKRIKRQRAYYYKRPTHTRKKAVAYPGWNRIFTPSLLAVAELRVRMANEAPGGLRKYHRAQRRVALRILKAAAVAARVASKPSGLR